MPWRTLRLLLAGALLTAPLAAVPAPEAGAVAFVACRHDPGFSCATVPVPLDRSGAVGGAVALKVERKTPRAGRSASAVVGLAGGPGQAALPLSESLAEAMAPALAHRDLLLFDQRGTGASRPLRCPALEGSGAGGLSGLFARCAQQIGPARGAFTTQESVQDIEALRQAGGYDKLVLYGTSYGTKVALEYAERYPQHVEALVLDSLVAPDGPEPFAVPTFQAIRPVLDELCGARACARVTGTPLGDIERLNARLRRHALSGSVYDGYGRRHRARLGETGLLDILEAGDLNPTLRALLPAAVRSALGHDAAPLLRLHLLSEGLIPNVPNNRPSQASEFIDEALFVATSCEETPFPWQRSGSPSARLAEALAALRALPRADFLPFDASTALGNSLVTGCAGWQDASPPPPAAGALPDVPTLILSGAQDLRTPTADARTIAARIPGAQLEVVPFVGHSVLGSDFSGCAERAVEEFFRKSPVRPCGRGVDIFTPTPVTPTRLANVRAPAGLAGKPGRTLTAVLDTLVDLSRQVIGATLQAEQALPRGSRFGGLSGGYARLSASGVTLRDLSLIPGVALSGALPVRNGELRTATIRITGAAASHGTVRFGFGKRVTGTLGGRSFDVSVAAVGLSRFTGGDWGDWPPRPPAFPLGGPLEDRPGGPR